MLLVLAERRSPDASIVSLSDALWYSVVTISTVGYGDLYPVTPGGKLLGVCFVLMSVGLLSFLVSAMVGFFTGRLVPALKRRHLRSKPWCIFSEVNDMSLALAADILEQEDCLCLFPKEQEAEIPAYLPYLCFDSMERLFREKSSGCRIFCMHEDTDRNYPMALKSMESGHPVYCDTQQAPDRCPEGLSLFDHYDCCARQYWHSMPLSKEEKTILLIGDGKYARQLLIRGLLINLMDEKQQIAYHVFGDWSQFRNNHRQLHTTLAIDREEPGKDSLRFHQESWNAEEAILLKADRILICGDDGGENLAVLRDLRQYFPITGKIHLRSEQPVPEEITFGAYRRICTAELILQNALTRMAKNMHEIYRSGADYPVPAWEELSEFTRQSNICAADHLLTRIRILLEDESVSTVTPELCSRAYDSYRMQRGEKADFFRALEHLRWMRFHSLYNWRWGESRDNAARIHPLMIPYERLSPQEQRKDDYAWELLGELGKRSWA